MAYKKITLIILAIFILYDLDAQIVYKDIDPDITTTINSTDGFKDNIVSIDFNGDSKDEYNFRWDDFGGGEWYLHTTFSAINEISLKGTNTNPYGARYIDPLMSSTSINSSLNWGNSYPEPLIGDKDDTNFQNLGDRFIGCKFSINGNTHYGWIRVKLDGALFTIKDYAYESEANTAIDAGEKNSLRIDKNEFNQFFSLYPTPSSNYIQLNTKTSVQIESIKLLSLNGNIALKCKKLDKNRIDISKIAQGVYLLQIKFNRGKVVCKKIVITN
jgi:hypothetical protein